MTDTEQAYDEVAQEEFMEDGAEGMEEGDGTVDVSWDGCSAALLAHGPQQRRMAVLPRTAPACMV